MPKYSCTLAGKIEEDCYGQFDSLAQAEAECIAVEQRCLQELVFEYAPGQAAELAPSDRIRIAKRVFGCDLSPEEARIAFLGLESDDLLKLVGITGLWSFLQERYSRPILIETLHKVFTESAYHLLRTLVPLNELRYWDMYYDSLASGNVVYPAFLWNVEELMIYEVDWEDSLEELAVTTPYPEVTKFILDHHIDLEEMASKMAENENLPFLLRILKLYPEEVDMIMEQNDNLPLLGTLASHGYGQNIEIATRYGHKYTDLSLKVNPAPASQDIYRALQFLNKPYQIERLRSLLSSYVPTADLVRHAVEINYPRLADGASGEILLKVLTKEPLDVPHWLYERTAPYLTSNNFHKKLLPRALIEKDDLPALQDLVRRTRLKLSLDEVARGNNLQILQWALDTWKTGSISSVTIEAIVGSPWRLERYREVLPVLVTRCSKLSISPSLARIILRQRISCLATSVPPDVVHRISSNINASTKAWYTTVQQGSMKSE
jgi:hypothetical protein